MPLRDVLLFVVLVSACATPAEKRRKAMEALCPRVQTLVCDARVLSVSPLDRATIVAAMLADDDPAYAALFEGIQAVAPKEKLPHLIASVSEIVGHPWSCAAWDATWEGNDACVPSRAK